MFWFCFTTLFNSLNHRATSKAYIWVWWLPAKSVSRTLQYRSTLLYLIIKPYNAHLVLVLSTKQIIKLLSTKVWLLFSNSLGKYKKSSTTCARRWFKTRRNWWWRRVMAESSSYRPYFKFNPVVYHGETLTDTNMSPTTVHNSYLLHRESILW